MASANENNPQLLELSNPAFFAGLLALAAIYLLLCSYQITQLPLIDPDEPRYAAAGRTMARGGSLLVPEFNGEKRINKPPLHYWLVALSMKLTGREDELGARLPSIAMGLLMLLGTAFLGRRVYGAKTGLAAAGVLASTSLFAALSRACITDMTLSAFVAGAIGLLMLALLERGPPLKLFWCAVAVFGLGILTKATPALALIAVVIVYRAISLPHAARVWAWRPILGLLIAAIVCSILAIYCDGKYAELSDKGKLASSTTGHWHLADEVLNGASLVLAFGAIVCVLVLAWRAGAGTLKRLPWIAGLCIAILCGAWWYLALIQMFGWPEFKRLLEFEVAERLAGGVHREGMHYYIVHLFAVVLPWAVVLPGALASAWPGSGTRAAEESSPEEHADRFLFAWVAGILLFFTIPGAKLATYILPAFPAVALLIARFAVRWHSKDESLSAGVRAWTVRLAIVFCAGLCVVGFLPLPYPDDFKRFLAALKVPFGVLGAAFGIGLAVSWWVAQKRAIAGVFATYLVTIAFVLSVAHAAFPVFLLGRTNRDLCLRVKDKITDCSRVMSYGAELESVVFYLDRTVVESRRRRVDENETIEAVVREELGTPGGTAIVMQRGYYARMIGVKKADLPFDVAELKRIEPAYAQVVDGNKYLVVLKPKGVAP